MKTNPLRKLSVISKYYDKNGFEEYRHAWANQPLGSYFQNEQIVGIIDYSICDYGPIPF